MNKGIDWEVVSDDLASSSKELKAKTEDCKKEGNLQSAAAFATSASVCAHLALAIIRGVNAAKESSHKGTLK